MTPTIVILAMIAVFVGLRLYSVLGQRGGHEQQPVARPAETPAIAERRAPPAADVAPERPTPSEHVYEERAEGGVRAILAADPQFDVARFLDGAQGAYRLILESYWRGDIDALAPYTDAHVREAFAEAVVAREAEGHRLDNRLIAVNKAVIKDALLEGRAARVTVGFDADVAAVTRDRDGAAVAGSLSDAVTTHDVWTFQRDLGSRDPNWILVETDEAA